MKEILIEVGLFFAGMGLLGIWVCGAIYLSSVYEQSKKK